MQLPPYPLAIERRVAFSETDAAGLIHFTTYFTFMEAAEAELFRSLGLPLLWSSDGCGYGFPRIDCQCRFRRPLHFDEPVRIELRLDEILDNRLYYSATFTGPSGERCATGTMATACARRTAAGRLEAAPLPEACRTALEKWKNQPA